MCIRIALLVLILCSIQTFGQNPDFWVVLSDKSNTPYSLDIPTEFLSQRAIDRRIDQGIELDQRDLPVDPDYIADVKAIPGVEYRYASKWFNALSIRCDSSILPQINALPFVSEVKVSRPLRPKEWKNEEKPVNVAVAIQRLPIEYGLSANQIMDVNGQVLHDLGYEGEGMVIAILDSGFDDVDSIASFDHLFLEERILSTHDFVDGDTEVYDGHFHGRAVLSTIAAIKEGEVYGTAVNASFHLLRTEDVASETTIEEWNWIVAAEYADSAGADVLNTSLSYTNMDTELESYSYDDMDGNTTWISRASDVAASRGMLVVNSAGNSGTNDWHFIGAPADGDSVLAVGSVDLDSLHTSFSSFGPSFDGRVKPNVCAQGRMAYGINEDDLVVPLNGTSFSSPITAGLATCLWQSVPGAGNMEVFQAIEMSAHLFNSPNDSLGYGIPDFGAAMQILVELSSNLPEFEDDRFIIFPNPASESLNIILNANDIDFEGISIFNMLGKEQRKEIVRISSERFMLDISSLSSGSYVIQLYGESGMSSYPFVKF